MPNKKLYLSSLDYEPTLNKSGDGIVSGAEQVEALFLGPWCLSGVKSINEMYFLNVTLKGLVVFCVAAWLLISSGTAVEAAGDSAGRFSAPQAVFPSWSVLDTGLELSFLPLPAMLAAQNQGAPLVNPSLVLLRIAPKHYEFVLLMASQQGDSRSFSTWLEEFNLIAAINASMYQKDGKTSTGLMRTRTHVNNRRLSPGMGGFFVCDPLKPGLPKADIIDRSNPRLNQLLSEYGTVLQNFRVLDPNGVNLWPTEGRSSSIAMIGKDKQGKILFIFSQSPLSPGAAGKLLLAKEVASHLHLSALIYLEGGREAGLVARANGIRAIGGGEEVKKDLQLWAGLPMRNLLGITPTMLPLPRLPNVLGVRYMHRD